MSLPAALLVGSSPGATALFFSEPTARFDVFSAGLPTGAEPDEFGDLGVQGFADLCSRCLAMLARTVREREGTILLEAMYPDAGFEGEPVYGWFPDREGRTVRRPAGTEWTSEAFLAIPMAVAARARYHGLIGGIEPKHQLLEPSLLSVVEEAADAWLEENGYI